MTKTDLALFVFMIIILTINAGFAFANGNFHSAIGWGVFACFETSILISYVFGLQDEVDINEEIDNIKLK